MEKTRQYSALAALAICALLGACNDEPAPKAKSAPPIPYIGPATGAAADTAHKTGDPVWRYNADEDHLLARGVDNSSIIDVVFRCGGGVPGITFSFFQPGPPPDTVKLASGATARDYPVRASPPDFAFSTDWSLGADAIPKDPVVGGFLETGKLTRGSGADAKVWDARTPKDREAIDSFAKACKGRL